MGLRRHPWKHSDQPVTCGTLGSITKRRRQSFRRKANGVRYLLTNGIAVRWLNHPEFRLGDGTLVYSRRMPSFFETFPTLFVDASGVVRADQPFRRAESKYALESKKLRVTFRGGALDGVSVSNRLTVATLARSAQFGELLDFDRESVSADGVLRTSPRGWYTFAHLCFGLLFFFGHWWHASRALYRDLIAGLEAETGSYIEFGSYARVGG